MDAIAFLRDTSCVSESFWLTFLHDVGLRQAPPQRVLFQPNLSSSRQTRHSSGNTHSPQPAAPTSGGAYSYNASSNPNNMSFTIANYEPRPQMPLTLRGVITPGNNLSLFKERQRTMKEATAPKSAKSLPSHKGLMLPGSKSPQARTTFGANYHPAGFDGPNIYIRTLMALQSKIPNEQDYALHHLVKISHERGDKYKFEAFPGLAEALIEMVLEVSSLFYNVHWEISYEEDGASSQPHCLNGMSGTADILQRIQSLQPLDTSDDMMTEEFNQKLTMINEAGLVIRNMAMLEENADYLSRQYPLRDFLCIALNLPHRAAVVELQHYALDIAEQLTRHWSLDAEDPLYISLLRQLDGTDRGAILTALRAISRISMNLEENNRLKGVPISTVESISEWTLLEDEELVHACLDFLYQFTAVIDNVELMLEQMHMGGLINQLVRLLLHGAKEVETRLMLKPPVKGKAATKISTIPLDLLEQILKFEEPERSSHWLRACFEEDAESDITQIALWQAYQSRFSEFNTPQHVLLPAAEFIKNVSTTFTGANAQVINGPNPKFIIKGIRPRHLLMDPKGRLYARCLWKPPGDKDACGEFLLKPKQMWEHLINAHIKIPKHEDGRYDFTPSTTPKHDCHWGECRRFAATGGSTSPYEIGMHIKTHLPDTSKKAPLRAKHNRSVGPDTPQEAVYQTHLWLNTQVDERGDAAGLPLTSALVLRNLARNLPKIVEGETEEGGWMRKLFGPVRERLWFVMAHNRPLAGYMADLMAVITAGGG